MQQRICLLDLLCTIVKILKVLSPASIVMTNEMKVECCSFSVFPDNIQRNSSLQMTYDIDRVWQEHALLHNHHGLRASLRAIQSRFCFKCTKNTGGWRYTASRKSGSEGRVRERLPFFAFFCSFSVSEDFFLISCRAFLYSAEGQRVEKSSNQALDSE